MLCINGHARPFYTAAQAGVKWSVENPSASLMWLTDPFRQLLAELKDELVAFAFHTCMFNASRKKRAAIWTSVEGTLQLQRDCDEQHKHEKWGLTSDNTFATAEECAYNAELAAHRASSILRPLLEITSRSLCLTQWTNGPMIQRSSMTISTTQWSMSNLVVKKYLL